MSGICGFAGLKREPLAQNDEICKMMDALSHRGPDGLYRYADEHVALGAAQLDIVNRHGNQHLFENEERTLVMLCSGRIYNDKELRSGLESRGHSFSSNCDTEIILHLYEEQDKDCLLRLNGQFSVCIYEKKRGVLFCARDPIGIVPFFYTVVDGLFLFASEIKALLAHPAVGKRRRVDMEGLLQTFCFPGMVSPQTMFEGIYSLKAGHYLLASENDVKDFEYWDLIYPPEDQEVFSMEESGYIEKLDDLLDKAVRARLRADVPLGFYLSGGLDSSLIAAKINRCLPDMRLQSFSIDFTQQDISESKYQKMMAQSINTEHHTILMDFDDIVADLKQAVYHSECALKETYNTASLALSRKVRERGVKVILTGEGADELFGGYVGYRFDQMRRHQNVHNDTAEELDMRRMIWDDPSFFYEKEYSVFLTKLTGLFSNNANERIQRKGLFLNPIIKRGRLANCSVFHKRSYVDFRVRMSDHLLADHGDRMVSANSIEARYPFLDKEIIEFAQSVPHGLKLKNMVEKYILKAAAENQVPQAIIRRPKFAFVAPGSPQLLQINNEYINDLLSYDTIRKQGYFNPEAVEQLKRRYTEVGFRLNVPYDDDMLIIVITFGMFLDVFNMPPI